MLPEMLPRALNLATHRLFTLPVLVLMPYGGCNCRCAMCDYWRSNRVGQELSPGELADQLGAFRRLRVRQVVLSGGEPLMHTNLWTLCELLRTVPARITLLTNGLLLERHAADVARWCDEVVVSLDGSRQVHNAVRQVPDAYDRLARGIEALRAAAPSFRVTARCTLQRANYSDLPNLVEAARDLGLDQLSFLAVDTFTAAFNRPVPWDPERVQAVALARDEVGQFRQILDQFVDSHTEDFASGFLAESPEKLRRLPRYFEALHGEGDFPANRCNAPWVSAAIEAGGAVRPCFFHRPYDNLHQAPLETILNSPEAVAFRRGLKVLRDPICRRCVCTLYLGPRTAIR